MSRSEDVPIDESLDFHHDGRRIIVDKRICTTAEWAADPPANLAEWDCSTRGGFVFAIRVSSVVPSLRVGS